MMLIAGRGLALFSGGVQGRAHVDAKIGGMEPEDLVLEDASEVSGDGVDGVLHGGRRCAAGGFELEAGDGAIGDAAGDDEVEVAQVGGDVEREAVRGDAARDVHADGGDFLLGDGAAGDGPDAGASGDALRGDGEVSQGADEGFFEEADVVDGADAAVVQGETAQVEDGVADELAGSVVGDVAAAVDLMDFDAAIGKEFVAGEDVGAGGVASQGEYGWVFEQEEGVADAVFVARLDELLLDVE